MISIMFALFGVISILIFYAFRKTVRKGKVIPGPNGLPFLGKALEITMENIHEKLTEYANVYGEIVQFKVGSDTLVSLNSVELVRKAFTEDPYKLYLNDRPEYYYGRTFIYGSKSLGFTPRAFGGVHSISRKCFTKAFHVYGEGIQVFEENIMREVIALIEKIDRSEDRDIEIISTIRQSMANILAYLLSGERMTNDDLVAIEEIGQSIASLINFHNNAILNTFPFLVHIPGFYKRIYDQCSEAKAHLVQRYFTRIKETHTTGEIRGMIDFLLDEQEKEIGNDEEMVWTDEFIIGNMLDLFAAGISTTLSVMSHTILLLSHHPDCQTKLQEELDSVLGDERSPTLRDRDQCPYLEAVVMESQRLLPALPLLQIHTTAQDLNFEGYHLPANCIVVPNAWYIMHDERVWGDPWTFRPVRFLDENGKLLPATDPLRKHWIPFGVGRRQCIAEQFARSRLFLFLSSLLHRYRFTPSPEQSDEDRACDPRGGNFDFTVVCRSKPFYCKLKRRYAK